MKRWIGAPAPPSAIEPKSVVFGSMSATCGGGAQSLCLGVLARAASWLGVDWVDGELE